MNDYIINPMWFYLVDFAGAIEILAAVVFGLFVCIIVACVYIYCDNDPEECCLESSAKRAEESRGKAIKVIKSSVVVLSVCAIIVCVIPTKDTFYQMLIAKYATYGNAQSLLDAIKNGTDYIVEALKALK